MVEQSTSGHMFESGAPMFFSRPTKIRPITRQLIFRGSLFDNQDDIMENTRARPFPDKLCVYEGRALMLVDANKEKHLHMPTGDGVADKPSL
jgi:hypothetical protein